MSDALGRGLLTMVRARRLAALAWVYGLLLAMAAVLPFGRWWLSATARAPEFDGLLHRFELATVAELTAYDLTPVWGLGFWWVMAIAVLAFAGNAWMNAGLLGVLADGEASGPLLMRFGHAAGLFAGRFLRVLLYVAVFDLIVLVTWAAIVGALADYVGRHGSSRQQLAVVAGGFGAGVAVIAYSSLVLDYARIRVLVERSRWPAAAVAHALWFVLRRAWSAVMPVVVFAGVFVLLVTSYLVIRRWVGGPSWLGLVGAACVQQAFMFARSAWRVGLLATELAIYRNTHPRWTTWGREPVEPGVGR